MIILLCMIIQGLGKLVNFLVYELKKFVIKWFAKTNVLSWEKRLQASYCVIHSIRDA